MSRVVRDFIYCILSVGNSDWYWGFLAGISAAIVGGVCGILSATFHWF